MVHALDKTRVRGALQARVRAAVVPTSTGGSRLKRESTERTRTERLVNVAFVY